MTVLRVSGLQKEFQGTPVLSDVSFYLGRGERLALVGANGCGKSTLLKLLAGEMMPDDGQIHWLIPGLRRACLCQEGHWQPDRPLGEQMGEVPPALLGRCGVTAEMLQRPAGTLSGGQKVRAALARTLAAQPDLLLLDEPTNHLDQSGLAWLAGLLDEYAGTLLLISHDRGLLDRIATRTLELQGGRVREYAGNYSAYRAEKEAELRRQEAEYAAYQRKKQQLEEALHEQQQRARAGSKVKVQPDQKLAKAAFAAKGKAAAQVAGSIEKRLERMKVEKPRAAPEIRLQLASGGKTAHHLVVATDLGFTHDGQHWLFRNASFSVARGERVAVVGPNGAGKSTLLHLIRGQLAPSEGRLRCAPAQTAYLDQEAANLPLEQTVLEAATGNRAADQGAARSLLGCLLFSRDDVFKRVRMLSGGEKVRLALARILLAGPDLLLLDEPTNHLDLLARERVEAALAAYPGSMVLVSHDRFLLRRVCNRVLLVAEGRLHWYPGSYAEWEQSRP